MNPAADQRHPMIVNIHGGPHGQQGPAFNFQNQVYAARGWATLMVNYRGSTGYGQAFADAVFARPERQRGAGRALRRERARFAATRGSIAIGWASRATSYGGQLIDVADHADEHLQGGDPDRGDHQHHQLQLHDLLQPVRGDDVGTYPHQGNLMDTLLQRSAIRHVAKAHTPTMLMHGENDNDVPIAEAEQFYVALKDVGIGDDHGPLPARRARRPRIEARGGLDRSRHQVSMKPTSAARLSAKVSALSPPQSCSTR